MSLKEQAVYQSLLAYFESTVGVNPIIEKLFNNLREKWTTRGSLYTETNGLCFPLVSFVKEMSHLKNDFLTFLDRATDDLQIDTTRVKDDSMKKFL